MPELERRQREIDHRLASCLAPCTRRTARQHYEAAATVIHAERVHHHSLQLPSVRDGARRFVLRAPSGRTFTILLVDDERGQLRAGPTRDDRAGCGSATSASTRLRFGAWPASTTSPSSRPRSSRCLLRRLLDARRERRSSISIPTSGSTTRSSRSPSSPRAHGIVLTPHTMRPYPARRPADRRLLHPGVRRLQPRVHRRRPGRRGRFSTGGGRRRGARR